MREKKKENQELQKIKPIITRILRLHGIKNAAIFGSYARGEQKKNSDVDILIRFNGSLLKLIGMERELSEKLKRKVDLITYGGLNPLLKDYILKDRVRII
ncbi:nucleotidyltransferase family protein [Candidatus Woesearchaeota archaeon]|nr:nucleotidyltransferase family protein [Candidatus Woesearchaeota archaeon]